MTRDELSAALDTLGMTRQEFADTLHISVDTVHGWMAPVGSARSRKVPPAIARIARWAVKRGRFPLDFNRADGRSTKWKTK